MGNHGIIENDEHDETQTALFSQQSSALPTDEEMEMNGKAVLWISFHSSEGYIF